MAHKARGSSKYVCHYCDDAPGDTSDHIVPRSRGGTDFGWNLVRACRTCNGAKRNDLPRCKCTRCIKAVEKHWQYVMSLRPSRRWPLLKHVSGLYFDRQPQIQDAWNSYVAAGQPSVDIRAEHPKAKSRRMSVREAQRQRARSLTMVQR